MRNDLQVDRDIAETLTILRETQERDPQKAAQGRAVFLAQAAHIVKTRPFPVPASPKRRHTHWIQTVQLIFSDFRKEKSPMLNLIGTLFLIVSLALGGSGVTVAAAQGSMPDDILYPVKTWSENVRVQLATQEQVQQQLVLQFAIRRAEEVRTMLQAGEVPPQAVQTQLQTQLELALRLAAKQDDPAMIKTLAQIRAQVQTQLQEFAGLGPQADPQGEAVLLQTRAMLQLHLQLCDEGLADPIQLRTRLQEGNLYGKPETPPANGYGPGPNDEPGDGSGYGPGPKDEPGDGNSYGPGKSDDIDLVEDPAGSQNSYGPGPDDDQTPPGPGCGGYGPGDGVCDGSGPIGPGGNTGGDDTGGANSGSGTTGGDYSGSGDTGSGATGGDASGSGTTGGSSSGGSGGGGK